MYYEMLKDLERRFSPIENGGYPRIEITTAEKEIRVVINPYTNFDREPTFESRQIIHSGADIENMSKVILTDIISNGLLDMLRTEIKFIKDV